MDWPVLASVGQNLPFRSRPDCVEKPGAETGAGASLMAARRLLSMDTQCYELTRHPVLRGVAL